MLETDRSHSDEKGLGFAAEFRLALACARWPLSASDRIEIHGLAEEPLNWNWFQRIVERNQILPLVYTNLREVLTDNSRVMDLRGIREIALGQMGNSMSQAAELARLAESGRRAGIDVVAIKGVALSALAYGNFALRSAGDIDLLVAPDRISDFEHLLKGMGYARIEPRAELTPKRLRHYLRYFKHFTYASKNTVLELHWRLFHNTTLSAKAESVFPPTIPVTIGRSEVLTLSRNELFLYLCAHGSIHGWPILKWLADVGALLNVMTVEELGEIATLASERGLMAELRATLSLVDLFLAIDRPRIELPCDTDPVVEGIVAMAQRLLTTKNYCLEMTNLPSFGMFFYDLRLRSSLRYRTEDLRRSIILPEDWEWIDLPDALFSLYAVVRPVSWLLRHLPGRFRKHASENDSSQLFSR